MATVAGEGASKPGSFGADAYPKADATLVGDIDALRTFYGVLADLHRRPPRSGIRQSDTEKVATAGRQVRDALAAQEQRVLENKPVKSLSNDERAELGVLLQRVVTAIRESALADDALQGRQ